MNSRRSVVVALCAAFCSGCALRPQTGAGMTRYVLNKIPPDLPKEQPGPATLLVLFPESNPIFASTRMAYTVNPYEVAYFSQNEWAATPPQMIQPLLVETVRRTGIFADVLSPPQFGRHTFTLRSDILELKQDFTAEPAVLSLAIRFSLSRDATNQNVATTELSVREPMRERTPYAGVMAANEAMEKLLREFARFVIDKAG